MTRFLWFMAGGASVLISHAINGHFDEPLRGWRGIGSMAFALATQIAAAVLTARPDQRDRESLRSTRRKP